MCERVCVSVCVCEGAGVWGLEGGWRGDRGGLELGGVGERSAQTQVVKKWRREWRWSEFK